MNRSRSCSECPTPIPVGVHRATLTCSSECRKARRKRLERERESSPHFPEHLQIQNWIPIVEVAKMNGVRPGAVRDWVVRHKARRVKWRGRNWIHQTTAHAYAAAREARAPRITHARPRGWLNMKQVNDLLGCSGETTRKLLREHTDLRTTKVHGHTVMVHPGDAEVLRRRLRSAEPLPGWIALADLATELGRRLTTLHIVVNRLGVETRWAARPGTRPAKHVTPSGAEQLRAWSASADRAPRRPQRRDTGVRA